MDAVLEQSFAAFDTKIRSAIGLVPSAEEVPAPVPDVAFRYHEAVHVLAADTSLEERTRAVSEVRKAAAAGHAPAQVRYGELLWIGTASPNESVQAVSWFEKAAAQGNGHAFHRLGEASLNGIGTPRDAERAVRFFRRAAAKDVAASQFMLGMLYLAGTGVPRDLAEGARWLARAQKNGHPYAGRYHAALR